MDLCLPDGRPRPGIRFAPTKEELVMFYLKKKVLGNTRFLELIPEINVYRYAPWDLPHMVPEALKNELVWHFFSPHRMRYSKGSRYCRATEFGYWKPTGEDRLIFYQKHPVAKIKTLVFHEGKSPQGMRTDWVMHEYRLDDQRLADQGIVQDTFVLCKIFQKTQQGPRNGAEYGAPFIEEEWVDIDNLKGGHPNFDVKANATADDQNNSVLAEQARPSFDVQTDAAADDQNLTTVVTIFGRDVYCNVASDDQTNSALSGVEHPSFPSRMDANATFDDQNNSAVSGEAHPSFDGKAIAEDQNSSAVSGEAS